MGDRQGIYSDSLLQQIKFYSVYYVFYIIVLRRNYTRDKFIPPFSSDFISLIIPYISKHFRHSYHKNHI